MPVILAVGGVILSTIKRNNAKAELADKEKIAALSRQEESEKRIVGDMILPGDFVVLVVPVDSAAPKGRLILPQQQTIRDILDAGGITVVVKDSELKDALDGLGRKPKMVITDSQAFDKVSKITPEDIMRLRQNWGTKCISWGKAQISIIMWKDILQ